MSFFIVVMFICISIMFNMMCVGFTYIYIYIYIVCYVSLRYMVFVNVIMMFVYGWFVFAKKVSFI